MVRTERSLAVESLRGAASFFVAFGHLYYAYFSKQDMELAVGVDIAQTLMGTPHGLPKFWLFIPRSAIWVNVFFLISGYVLQYTLETRNSLNFLIQRFFRIAPVLWLALTIQILLNLNVFGKPSGKFLESYLLLDSNLLVVTWTLVIEVHFYTLLAILTHFVRKLEWRIAVIHGLFFMVVALMLLFEYEPFHVHELYYFCYMSIGMSFYAVRRNNDIVSLSMMASVLFMCFIEYQICNYLFDRFTENDNIAFISAISVFFLPIVFFDGVAVRPLIFLGKISYPLYCIHFPVGWLVHFLLVGQLGARPLVGLIVALTVVILLSVVVHHFIERPFQRFGKRWF